MSNLLAKVGGFFLVPVVGTVATRVVTTLLPEPESAEAKLNRSMAIAGAAYLATAGAAYSFSKKRGLSKGERAFARGGMWGAGLATVTVPTAYVLQKQLEAQPKQIAAGSLATSKLALALDTLTGGSIGTNGIRVDRAAG